MRKLWGEKAWEQYLNWQAQDKRTLKKIHAVITSIERDGYNSIGKPELLKYEYSGYYSTRIDDKNRLVYRIDGNVLEIILCGSHYENQK